MFLLYIVCLLVLVLMRPGSRMNAKQVLLNCKWESHWVSLCNHYFIHPFIYSFIHYAWNHYYDATVVGTNIGVLVLVPLVSKPSTILWMFFNSGMMGEEDEECEIAVVGLILILTLLLCDSCTLSTSLTLLSLEQLLLKGELIGEIEGPLEPFFLSVESETLSNSGGDCCLLLCCNIDCWAFKKNGLIIWL